MKLNFGEKLSLRIRSALHSFHAQALTELLHSVGPTDALSSASLDALAERMADPAWSRLAVRDLDDAALTALRILARLPNAVSARELDMCARLLSQQDEGAAFPSKQLLAAGIAIPVTTASPMQRTRETRICVVGPLRERWLALTPPPPESGPIPLLPEGEEAFQIQKVVFRMGVTLAAIENMRPRATRVFDLHRSDAKTLAEKLANLAGSESAAQELIRQMSRRDLIDERDGRLRLIQRALQRWQEPLAPLLHERFAERLPHSAWRAAFGELYAAETWVPMSRIIEVAVLASLELGQYGHDAARQAISAANDLAHTPGVVAVQAGGILHLRLTEPARRVLNGEPSGLSGASGLVVQPNLEIVAQPGVPLNVLARLGSFCRLISADAVAVFALDETTARRAAGEGWTPAEILRLLETNSIHGVPSTVARAITDWVRTQASAVVTTGVVVVVDLPLSDIRRMAGNVHVEQVAPNVFRVDEAEGPAFVSALRKGGVACRSGPESLQDGDENALPVSTDAFKQFVDRSLDDVRRLKRAPID